MSFYRCGNHRVWIATLLLAATTGILSSEEGLERGTCLRSAELRNQLKDYLRERLSAKLNHREALREEIPGLDMPFHRRLLAFMPEAEVDRVLLDSKFMASLSTSMGSWYEQMAALIAQERFGRAQKVRIEGTLSEGGADAVAAIMRDLENRAVKPSYADESRRIREAVAHGDATNPRRVAITVDFFVPDANGVVFAAEMKTPRPNRSMVKSEKRKLLELRALLYQQFPDKPPDKIRTCFAFPYNPYKTRPAFEKQWAFGREFVDFRNEFLVGKEFWDYIGGEGTYEALLEIVQEVGASMKGQGSSKSAAGRK